MAENLHSPEVYDFRRYDRVWQRVAPDLEPYPGVSTAAAHARAPAAGGVRGIHGPAGESVARGRPGPLLHGQRGI